MVSKRDGQAPDTRHRTRAAVLARADGDRGAPVGAWGLGSGYASVSRSFQRSRSCARDRICETRDSETPTMSPISFR